MVSGLGVPGCGMAVSADVTEALAAKFAVMLPHLDERQRRLYLGSEARALGHGGIAAVARAAGGGGGWRSWGWGGGWVGGRGGGTRGGGRGGGAGAARRRRMGIRG